MSSAPFATANGPRVFAGALGWSSKVLLTADRSGRFTLGISSMTGESVCACSVSPETGYAAPKLQGRKRQVHIASQGRE